MPGRRIGKGEAHKSATGDDKIKISQRKHLRNQLQLRRLLPGRQRIVRFDDEASQLPCQELEIAVGGPFRGEVCAKSPVEGCAARVIETWRFLKFLTEHIEQS